MVYETTPQSHICWIPNCNHNDDDNDDDDDYDEDDYDDNDNDDGSPV